MKFRALVIDDDPDIAEAVGEHLSEWLQHDYDHAASVECARKFITQRRYNYVLLDLELPLRAGKGTVSVQNGERLLEEMKASSSMVGVPVIVMTAHGTDSPMLAVEMMKKGAVDYVTKPFPKTGNTLDKAIREALLRTKAGIIPATGTVGTTPDSIGAEPANSPSARSEMVFYPDKIELWGVKICDQLRSSQERILLDVLRAEGPKGGAALAKLICQEPGQNAVSQCVRRLRLRLCGLFSASNSWACDPWDVILSGGPGYRFNRMVKIVDLTKGAAYKLR